jgi:hypothetical protein
MIPRKQIHGATKCAAILKMGLESEGATENTFLMDMPTGGHRS